MRKLFQAMSVFGMLFYYGQFDAFGLEMGIDLINKSGKQLVTATTNNPIPGPINDIPQQSMITIFEGISKFINPRHLPSVCMNWQNDFGLKNEYYYADMSQFMQRCMNIFWTNQSYTKQFFNGVLKYTSGDGNKIVQLPFSSLKDGTFDLSTCGNIGQHLVITTCIDRFLTIGGNNKDKTVVLIVLRHLVEKEVNSQEHPFYLLLEDWKRKVHVGMFWRWGNDTDLTRVDYLTWSSMLDISSLSLVENWEKSEPGAMHGNQELWVGIVGMQFFRLFRDVVSCQFFEQKGELFPNDG